MAIVKTSTPSVNISYFLDFFEGLNCPLITVDRSNNKVSIGENAYFTITVGTNVNYSRNFNFSENGSSWTSAQYQNVTIFVCCSETFVYIKLTSGSGNTYTVYLYEEVDEDIYSGHYIGSSSSCNIYDVTLNCWSNNNSYKHGKRLNYSCELGYIDFAKEVYFNSSGVKQNIEPTGFIACSNVTTGQVITFEGKNYYSLGSNVLVEFEA